MKLACPECQTPCGVVRAAQGPGGGQVRCHNCGHVWMPSGAAVKGAARLRMAARVAALAAAAALIAGGALYARTGIARLLPGAAGLYAAVGYPVNLRGVEFRDVTVETTVEEGVSVLSVRGHVVNVTKKSVAVPTIRFAVRDGARVEIYRWLGETDASELAPAESAAFLSRLASPPIAGEDIEIRFVGGRS